MMRGAWMLVLAVVSGCGGGGECTRDTDCKGARICRAGACVDQGPGPLLGAGTAVGAGPAGGSGAGLSGGGFATGGGAATGGGSTAGGGATAGGSPTGDFRCCINQAFYGCADKAAFDRCSGFDLPACMDACAPTDFACRDTCFQRQAMSQPDPSACTRDSSRDGTCGTSGTCNDNRGVACTLNSQCSTSNCTDGYCRQRSVGSRCTLNSHCESSNCTDGCCRGNGVGSACTLNSHCDSSNCTNGRCSGNSRGSACTLNSHCTSGNCTNGRCQ